MHLSNVIDRDIANQTVNSMDKMLGNFNLKITKKHDPFVEAYTSINEIIKRKKSPEMAVELIVLIESVCQRGYADEVNLPEPPISQRTFTGPSTLAQGDETTDLLNNVIGRELGKMNRYKLTPSFQI